MLAANALNATSLAVQTPRARSSGLVLESNQAQLGTAIQHEPGSTDISLGESGTYELIYSAMATSADRAVPPVTASMQLTLNGRPIPGTLSESTIPAPGHTVTLAGSAMVTVSGPAVVNLVPNNVDCTFSNASVTVRKLD